MPKGTEHYISDLHGEDEAFIHLLNSASGVIREKVDLVLGENVPKAIRAELATLIYYPARKLPLLKARYPERFELEAWYRQTLLRLIDVCRFVSSKHTREYVRSCLPQGCGHIIDELQHAHFEDHNKTLYYGQIVGSTTTIVAGMYQEKGLMPTAKMAGLMAAAIVSDTVMFKSPTCCLRASFPMLRSTP